MSRYMHICNYYYLIGSQHCTSCILMVQARGNYRQWEDGFMLHVIYASHDKINPSQPGMCVHKY